MTRRAQVGYRAGLVLILALLLSACGGAPPTDTPLPPTATLAPPTATTAPPSATPLPPSATPVPPTDTAVPPSATALPPSATPLPPTPVQQPPTVTALPPTATTIPATATPSGPARPTSTEEPDSCIMSDGQVQTWGLRVYAHQSGDTQVAIQGLKSACAADRWLALWAVGSIHDPAGVPAVRAYLAAHPKGDWLYDRFDMVPLAQATLAYLQAPQDAKHTYTVANVSLYTRVPQFDDLGGATPGPAVVVPPGTALTLVARVPTGTTRPDHGGETDVVFEKVQRAGDAQTYFMDISGYVSATPRYFEPATPAAP